MWLVCGIILRIIVSKSRRFSAVFMANWFWKRQKKKRREYGYRKVYRFILLFYTCWELRWRYWFVRRLVDSCSRVVPCRRSVDIRIQHIHIQKEHLNCVSDSDNGIVTNNHLIDERTKNAHMVNIISLRLQSCYKKKMIFFIISLFKER